MNVRLWGGGGAMGRINYSRVILGGLVAGLVLFAGEILLGVITGDQWATVTENMAIPEPGVGAFTGVIAITLAYGILLVWFYAAIRPRFGSGARTAVIAGLAVWVSGWLLTNGSFIVVQLFPTGLMVTEIVAGAIKLLAAAIAGAWVYRETAPSL